MANSAASSLKEVTMELGGKSPLIVCDDADLDLAADIAMMANFYSSGQVCTNGTRVLFRRGLKRRSRKKFSPAWRGFVPATRLRKQPTSVRW